MSVGFLKTEQTNYRAYTNNTICKGVFNTDKSLVQTKNNQESKKKAINV